MSNPRARLAAINALPLPERVRILHLSGDQERAISQSQLRRLLPPQVELLAGPGCAATVCPSEDIQQAVQLAMVQGVTLLTDEALLRIPGPIGADVPRSLAEAQATGADIRTVSAPIEAVVLAREMPGREVVLFLAGFETLLVPLAGQLLEGLPENLSLLLCGRRVESLLEESAWSPLADFDALILPGNHCALLGVAGWERLAAALGKPAVVAGYSASGLLVALEALLAMVAEGGHGVINRFQSLARDRANPAAEACLSQVFERVGGRWRGNDRVIASAYRLRPAFARHDADRRFPNYRPQVGVGQDFDRGCQCRAVTYSGLAPTACAAFRGTCRPGRPVGPCMASVDGTCRIQSTAAAPSLRFAVGG
jgi:hydrogenase expression/formation protein HypD